MIVENGQEVMDLIREELSSQDPYLIAKRVGCSKSTIVRIKSGKTKWPREATLFSLVQVLGLQVSIIRRNT